MVDVGLIPMDYVGLIPMNNVGLLLIPMPNRQLGTGNCFSLVSEGYAVICMLHMHFQDAKAFAVGHSEQRERPAYDEFHVLEEWEK